MYHLTRIKATIKYLQLFFMIIIMKIGNHNDFIHVGYVKKKLLDIVKIFLFSSMAVKTHTNLPSRIIMCRTFVTRRVWMIHRDLLTDVPRDFDSYWGN